VNIPSLPVGFLTPLTQALLPTAVMDQLNRFLGLWSANDATSGRLANPREEVK
jgi:hypothetical protein